MEESSLVLHTRDKQAAASRQGKAHARRRTAELLEGAEDEEALQAGHVRLQLGVAAQEGQRREERRDELFSVFGV